MCSKPGCCGYLECYNPPNKGDACLPAPTSGAGAIAMGTAPICAGSPTTFTTCDATLGPFAGPVGDPKLFTEPAGATACLSTGPVGTAPSPFQDGACCYVVQVSVAVPGRPLSVAGAARVASLGTSAAWC
jgi:hypothetical protein